MCPFRVESSQGEHLVRAPDVQTPNRLGDMHGMQAVAKGFLTLHSTTLEAGPIDPAYWGENKEPCRTELLTS